MRRWIVAVSLLILFSCLLISDADASEMGFDDAIYGYETHGSGHPDYYCVITSVTSNEAILHLPSVLEGYDVRSYSDGAFDGCSSSTLIVPKNLRAIEDGAFSGCESLKNIYFMGDRPVMGDVVPKDVVIHTLSNTAGWTNTEIIEMVTSNGIDYALLPDGAAVIGGKQTDGVISIRNEVNGNKVVRIDDYAFAGTMMDDGNVKRRSDIKSVVTNDGLQIIGKRAFYYNDLIEIRISDSVKEIQDEAFRACYNLSGVSFSDNVHHIGFETFRDCHSIMELTILKTVRYVGDGAFYICDSLESLNVDTNISPRMFGYCTSLRELTLGDSVNKIGHSAFYQCESLESVKIPEKVKDIGKEAFRDCVSLKKMDLKNVENIGRMAFRGCESLRVMSIPSTVSMIEGYAFADCISLRSIDAYGMAPKGDDTVFLNVDAMIHCKGDAVDSWESSEFGLEVVGDLDGSGNAIVSLAIVGMVALSILIIIVLIMQKKGKA